MVTVGQPEEWTLPSISFLADQGIMPTVVEYEPTIEGYFQFDSDRTFSYDGDSNIAYIAAL